MAKRKRPERKPISREAADQKRVIDEYSYFVQPAIMVFALTAALPIIKERLAVLRTGLETTGPSLLLFLPFILMLFSFLYVLIWIPCGKRELRILQTHLAPYAPELPASGTALVIATCVVVLVLIWASNDIVYYASIYLVYQLIAAGANWTVRRNISRALQKARSNTKIPPEYLGAVRQYYLQRPFVRLGICTFIIALLSLILAAQSKWFITDPNLAIQMLYAAYILQIFSIAVGEIQMAVWRVPLYRATEVAA